MRKLAEFFPDLHTAPGRNLRSRTMNALWKEFYPRRLQADRPADWEPDPDDAAALFLEVVPGLGPKGRAIVRQWLAQREEATE